MSLQSKTIANMDLGYTGLALTDEFGNQPRLLLCGQCRTSQPAVGCHPGLDPGSILIEIPITLNQVSNLGVGDCTTLNDFFQLRDNLNANGVGETVQPLHRALRTEDVLHSQPHVSKTHRIADGIQNAMYWHVEHQNLL